MPIYTSISHQAWPKNAIFPGRLKLSDNVICYGDWWINPETAGYSSWDMFATVLHS